MKPTALALFLALALGGCDGEPAGRTGPDDGEEPDPPVFDWVGRWSGTASGADRGEPVEEDVTLVISFDGREECELCVRVELGHLFDRDSLLVTDPIRSTLSYADADGRDHLLELQRHSTGDGPPGTTIIGRAEVRAPAAEPGSGELLHVRDLVVVKENR